MTVTARHLATHGALSAAFTNEVPAFFGGNFCLEYWREVAGQIRVYSLIRSDGAIATH